MIRKWAQEKEQAAGLVGLGCVRPHIPLFRGVDVNAA